MTRGDKGKLFIRFVPLFTLSLFSKTVCSLWNDLNLGSISIDFDRLYRGLRQSNFQSILTCDAERIVDASPPGYFANGKPANVYIRRKNITQSLREEYTFAN